MAENAYESALMKARKLAALAAGGVEGERENAQEALRRHLEKHGLKLEQLRTDDRLDRDLDCWMPGTKPLAQTEVVKLAVQCLCFVMNQPVKCFQVRTRREWLDRKKKRVWVPCYFVRATLTELEFEDWKACFLHFLPDFLETERRMKLALKQCLNGFVHQHRIFRDTQENEECDGNLSREELEALIDAMRGAQGSKWQRPAGRLEQPGLMLT